MSQVVIELRSVSKWFGARILAVDNVSLDFREGEFFSILGPSGCGKTTLLRLIAGLETPDSGEILMNGEVINSVPPHRRDVNMVFQNYALFPHMSVYDNVGFGLKMKGIGKKESSLRIARALELVSLPDVGDRNPKHLSGGQQQRVALARAIVNEPSVLLLDEPLGALDLKLRQQMQTELKSLQKRLGITFIYVTHDQDEAMTMSDRIAVMNKGRIVQVGTPSEIYEKPSSVFVADFMGMSNLFSGTAEISDDGLGRFITAGGLVLNFVPNGRSTSGGVKAMIRPEKINLASNNDFISVSGMNLLSGTIDQLIYLGSVVRVVVDVGGEKLNVLEKSDNRSLDLTVGQNVIAVWDIGNTVILPTGAN